MLAYNNDPYLAIVFIHVFAAIVWVGGAFFFQVKIAQLRKANDTAGFLVVGRDAEHIGQRVFMPASIIVLLSGIAMVWYGAYTFKLWIVLALIGIVVTAATGAIYLGPQGGRFAKIAEERGVDDRLRGARPHRPRHGVQAGGVAAAGHRRGRSTPRSEDHMAYGASVSSASSSTTVS